VPSAGSEGGRSPLHKGLRAVHYRGDPPSEGGYRGFETVCRQFGNGVGTVEKWVEGLV